MKKETKCVRVRKDKTNVLYVEDMMAFRENPKESIYKLLEEFFKLTENKKIQKIIVFIYARNR